jgi:para-nitrobenzyl esterase
MKRMIAALLGFSALAAVAVAQTGAAKPENVKVKIDAGTLVGETKDGVNIFRGVPFAKAPVGELRWKAPVKPDAWPGERYATAFEPPCPQPVNIDQKS